MPEKLNAVLNHIAIHSEDPEALSDFYAKLFHTKTRRLGEYFHVKKENRSLLFTYGKKNTLAFSAYSFDSQSDLSALERRLEKAGATTEVARGPLWRGDALRTCDPNGNIIEFGLLPTPDSIAADGPHARLQHVVFATTDVVPVEAFYLEACGFGLSDHVLDEAGDVRSSFMHSDHEHHALALFKAPEIRLDHHCYEAHDWNDLRDWADHFANLGLKLQWGPGRHGPGNNLFLFVNDPDGNWIEISAELEQLPDDREAGQWRHEERTLNLWGHGKLRS